MALSHLPDAAHASPRLAPAIRIRWTPPVLVLSLLVAAALVSPALADILSLYDDVGRLVRVIREDGEAATYHYDAVGNILRISRESGVPQATVVSTVSTATLPRSRSTTVTFSGANFSGAAVTASPGISVTGIRADVDTLVVQVSVEPAASLGPASLTLRTPHGAPSVPFTITGGPPLVIALSPARALAGMLVVVGGAEFDPAAPAANEVRINGTVAPVLQASATSLTIRVPDGATTGPVSVTTASGTGTSAADLAVGTLGPRRAGIPTADLIAYWSFDLDGRDDAASFDLVLQGGLDSSAAGAIGRGLAFDGDPGRVAARPRDDDLLNLASGDFSVALWAKWTSIEGERVLVEKCQGASLCNGGAWGLTKLSDHRLLAFPFVVSEPGAVAPGRWYHIALTREGSAARLYLDGIPLAERTGAGGIAPVSDPLQIGERTGPQTFPMNGVIDEVAIWARALSPPEVAALAALFDPGPPRLTRVSPAKALPGMVVTVTGGEFDGASAGNNLVRVNGIGAPVLDATASTLRIRVPAGVATGPVSVTTPWGTGQSETDLVIGTLGPSRAGVPTTDLLAYWTFDADGRDAADSHDLTLEGGLTVTAPGVIGQGLAFPGDPAAFATLGSGDGTFDFGAADFSLVLLARWSSVAGEQVLIEKCRGATGCSAGFTLSKLADNALLASPLVVSAPGVVAEGRWYHVALVRQGSTARLYLDGAEIADAEVGDLSIPAVEDPLRIGERGGPQSFPMTGVIDEAGIWARALSPAEVAALAAATRPP